MTDTIWPCRYLRATGAAEMTAALSAALGTVENEAGTQEPEMLTETHQCVIRGPLEEPTGELDEQGAPVMQAIPGYHADLLIHPDYEAALIEALAPVVIEPQPVTPQFQWSA